MITVATRLLAPKELDMARSTNHVRQNAGRGIMLLLLALSTLSLVGCGKPLLAPDEERSQFDRYDTVRNQYATQTVEDEFGRVKPNLRNRLTPKD
jgi:predicted small lipoprotein YifL